MEYKIVSSFSMGRIYFINSAALRMARVNNLSIWEETMGKRELYTKKLLFITKCMLAAYVLTAGLLLLLAFMLYRFRLSEKVVSLSIIAIYVVVTFLLGMLAGKTADRRRFLWGLVLGVAYYVILVVVSLIVNKGAEAVAANMLTTFLLCAGSGMLGGMLS
jgi:putative membrane protein (TIGR04086 family)